MIKVTGVTYPARVICVTTMTWLTRLTWVTGVTWVI